MDLSAGGHTANLAKGPMGHRKNGPTSDGNDVVNATYECESIGLWLSRWPLPVATTTLS